MPLHMRMPKHGFKSRSKMKKTILKTDFLNFCFERNLIGKKNTLKIEDIEKELDIKIQNLYKYNKENLNSVQGIFVNKFNYYNLILFY